MKLWPSLQENHITYYLLKAKACDLEDVQAIKSLDLYNYVISGKVGQLLVCQADKETCFIKGKVSPSQADSDRPYETWVCIGNNCRVWTRSCSCKFGLTTVCSHVGKPAKLFDETDPDWAPSLLLGYSAMNTDPSRHQHLEKRRAEKRQVDAEKQEAELQERRADAAATGIQPCVDRPLSPHPTGETDQLRDLESEKKKPRRLPPQVGALSEPPRRQTLHTTIPRRSVWGSTFSHS
ncbi:hypothetical protein HPB49_025356 [Dermacentor silvarum]|uniref:Uncharacterized protein n=1 Tax=Dermacentor silvarum TaxID=543639 RepID=A0ACB8D983_DERSI|nr:hypothetical protein HPB49_025356 [Dermacentor silvarum]